MGVRALAGNDEVAVGVKEGVLPRRGAGLRRGHAGRGRRGRRGGRCDVRRRGRPRVGRRQFGRRRQRRYRGGRRQRGWCGRLERAWRCGCCGRHGRYRRRDRTWRRGGAAGTGGIAGAIGRGGAGGAAGTGGRGGTSGIGGTSGTGGTSPTFPYRVPCPAAPPTGACSVEWLTCAYPDQTCACDGSAWHCLDCPSVRPTASTTCPTAISSALADGGTGPLTKVPLNCNYGSSTCSCDVWAGTWGCGVCPASAPSTNTSCGNSSFSCFYADRTCLCSGGLWGCQTIRLPAVFEWLPRRCAGDLSVS